MSSLYDGTTFAYNTDSWMVINARLYARRGEAYTVRRIMMQFGCVLWRGACVMCIISCHTSKFHEFF